MRNRKGFTFIELMTVVVVAGVMVTIAVPRLRVSEAMEVQLAGMQLAQDLDFARTRALSTRNRVRVVFVNTSTPSYVSYLDANNDSTFAESVSERTAMQGFGERPLPVRVVYGRGSAPPFPGDPSNTAISFASNRAEFDTRGLVTPIGSSGAVYLRHANKPQAVVAVALSGSGNVRVWTYNGGVWK